jgi:hypothetical protein
MSTYYVSTSGSNAAAGTSEGAAWLTIDKGMNTVAAGDKVWVKADGDYVEKPIIDTAGTNIAPIVFEGYTATPGDGGRATITRNGAAANCLIDSLGGANIFYVFKNFRFTSPSANSNIINLSGNYVTFKNCKIDSASVAGGGLNGFGLLCESCEFISNGGGGVWVDGNGGIFIDCIFYSNGGYGLYHNGGALVVICCTFFDNVDAMFAGTNNGTVVVFNCTIDGNSKVTQTGLDLENTTGGLSCFANSVFYDCVRGIRQSTASRGERVMSRNNCVNANTTAYTNAATFTGEVTSAPQFVNEVGGADYTPAAGSPLIDAGFDAGS